ncbi:MAG: hypothetical protein M3M94_07670, partial [Actinomycetota bacterium]|nr:hypothetical protein [Actinomycetota bacterium]
MSVRRSSGPFVAHVLLVAALLALAGGLARPAVGMVLGDTTTSTSPTTVEGDVLRASVSTGGTQANGWSEAPAISGDGSVVAFTSYASNLVSGDTNAAGDVFARDAVTGTTTRASVGASGQANGKSQAPTVSADGNLVAFESSASNLVSGDTNGVSDVFVRDLSAGTTTRVSLSSGGAQGSGASDSAAISADGRFVAFRSFASNLVSGDTNGYSDIFVRDLQGGTTTRVSVNS